MFGRSGLHARSIGFVCLVDRFCMLGRQDLYVWPIGFV